MTMNDPTSEARRDADAVSWLQDQVSGLKAQLARTVQQGDQVQAALLDVNEKLREAETKLRELGARTVGVPVMQEQMRQISGLMERIQDAEVMIDTKFELVERVTNEERTRDQAEKNDLYRRVQELERRAEGLIERQQTIDESSHRFQDEVARTHLQQQSLNSRLEAVESKTGRNLDAMTRIEQTQSEIEQAVRALRREDDVLAERTRLAHEVAARLEVELHEQQEEYRALPLLAERVELLRAERQRLEDRTSRLEETLDVVLLRVEREEEASTHVDGRIKAHDQRLDQVHSSFIDYRRSLSDHLLKLNQTLERTKRREIEELERQSKELRVHSNQMKNEDDFDS